MEWSVFLGDSLCQQKSQKLRSVWHNLMVLGANEAEFHYVITEPGLVIGSLSRQLSLQCFKLNFILLKAIALELSLIHI